MKIKLNNFKNKILWNDKITFLNPTIIHYYLQRYPDFIIMLEFENETYIAKNNSNIIVIKEKIKNILKKI